MWVFFHRYQRFLFLLIAIVVIASFAFFGAFGTFLPMEGGQEEIWVGEAVDGSKVGLRELQRLSRFLAAENEDLWGRGSGSPNFCNDGVVRRDFLESGVAEMIVGAHWGDLKPWFEERFERMRRYRPYCHAESAELSAKTAWGTFAPQIPFELEALQQQSQVDIDTFRHLARLYLLEKKWCPPEFLRQWLLYRQKESPWLKMDPRLPHEEMALFGFHSYRDWFGPQFLDHIAMFIVQGARLAEKRGYEVSLEEAKADLRAQFNRSMQRLKELKLDPSLTFHAHLRQLGFDEESAAQAWRSVLLWRRYFHSVGDGAWLDSFACRQFARFAQEKAHMWLYRLPQALQFLTLRDWVDFELYAQSVGAHRGSAEPLALPHSLLSLEEIEKRSPELVESEYRLQMASLTKKELGLEATLKELWDWEVEETHWKELREKFSFLPEAKSREERLLVLDRLEGTARGQVDRYARLAWVDGQSGKIATALAAAPLETKNIFCTQEWSSLGKVSRLLPLLEKAAAQEMKTLVELQCYSEDGLTWYRIEGVEKLSDRHLLSLEEAKTRGSMERLLKRKMGRSVGVHEKQLREWVEVAFPEVIRSMGGIDRYRHRLDAWIERAFKAIQVNPEDPSWVCLEEKPSLEHQFLFIRQKSETPRNLAEGWVGEEAFSMAPRKWSSLHSEAVGNLPLFFYLAAREDHPEPSLMQMAKAQEIMREDAARFLAQHLLYRTWFKSWPAGCSDSTRD